MEGTYELDRLIGASPASASVLDIMAASGTKEASADYREATGEVINLEGKLHRCNNLIGGDLSIFHQRWLWSLLRRPLRKLPSATAATAAATARKLPLPLLGQRTPLMRVSPLPTTFTKVP